MCVYSAVGSLLAASLEPLAHHRRCSSELGELALQHIAIGGPLIFPVSCMVSHSPFLNIIRVLYQQFICWYD